MFCSRHLECIVPNPNILGAIWRHPRLSIKKELCQIIYFSGAGGRDEPDIQGELIREPHLKSKTHIALAACVNQWQPTARGFLLGACAMDA